MSRFIGLQRLACLALALSAAPAHARAQQPQSAQERQRAADEQMRNDWANLRRYRAANDSIGLPGPGQQRVVFMGNSITDAWARYFPAMFPGKPYVGRGISGQTTPQMLVRFRQDVIALKPAVVVILAGTNDIAGNTGPSTLEMIEDNLASMTELAKANGIRVVLSSVLPVYDYPWRRGLEPAPKIAALNAWMKAYAGRVGAVYLDYYSAMVDDRQGLRSDLTYDGVHPTEAGYRVMAPLAEQAIEEALRTPGGGDSRAEIDAFNRALDDATRHMDNAATLALWDDDGVSLLPAAPPIVGKKAIASFLEDVTAKHPGGRMQSFTLDCSDVQVTASSASEWCTEHQVVTFADGNRFDGRGKMLLVLRRGADGKWRLHDEMWNQGE